MKTIFSENTMVPVSLLIVILGGMFWLTTMFSEVRANSLQISEMKTDQQKKAETLVLILERLSSIESELKRQCK